MRGWKLRKGAAVWSGLGRGGGKGGHGEVGLGKGDEEGRLEDRGQIILVHGGRPEKRG